MDAYSLSDLVAYFGDDAGAAWLLIQRRSDLPWSAVRKIVRMQDKRDTFGTVGRTSSRTVCRQRIPFSLAEHDLATHDVPGLELSPALASLPPAFATALSEGRTIRESAELAGIPLRIASRMLSEIREKVGAF